MDFSEKWGTDVDTAVQLALADLKLIVRTVIDHWNRQAAEPHINRTLVFVCRFHSCPRLDIVTRNDDCHARNRPHQRDILVALVGRAVLAD